MEILEEERIKQLSELDEYIKSSKDQLNFVLDSLGWNLDVLQKEVCFV